MMHIDINSTDYWTGVFSTLSITGVLWALKLLTDKMSQSSKPPLIFGRLTCSTGELGGVLNEITYYLQISNRDTSKLARIEALFNHGEHIPLPKPFLVDPGGNGTLKVCSFGERELPSTWKRPYKMQVQDSEGRKWQIAIDNAVLRALEKVEMLRKQN